jgi:hypothetical protein
VEGAPGLCCVWRKEDGSFDWHFWRPGFPCPVERPIEWYATLKEAMAEKVRLNKEAAAAPKPPSDSGDLF